MTFTPRDVIYPGDVIPNRAESPVRNLLFAGSEIKAKVRGKMDRECRLTPSKSAPFVAKSSS
jgi:hypothetical protein